MQSIIFYKIETRCHPQIYTYSVQLSHILGFTTVGIGIGENVYNFRSGTETIPVLNKIDYLKTVDNANANLLELETELKHLLKVRHKSSKEIVLIKQAEVLINKMFMSLVDDHCEKLERVFKIETMKDIYNSDAFLNYITDENHRVHNDSIVISEVDLLQLLIPNEKGHPLFFLNIAGSVDDITHITPENKKAESLSAFYTSNLLNIPNLSLITSNQIELVRDDLKIGSEEFRAKLNQWATICYENPNTTLGLDYFRANLLPLKETADDLATQSPTLNSFSEATNHKGKASLLFGEAPIESIWKNYLETETISQEIFDKLLEIKKEQAPKFDGRWPVAFVNAFDTKEDLNEESEDKNSETAIKSVRKSISLE